MAVGKMLAKYNGKRVEFLPESGSSNKADIMFDGVKWDIKFTTTLNEQTIRAAIKNARKAGRAIFYWDGESKLNALRNAVSREK